VYQQAENDFVVIRQETHITGNYLWERSFLSQRNITGNYLWKRSFIPMLCQE